VTRAESHTNDEPVTTNTILVVEDEEYVRSLAVRMLERFGYATLQAATGAEALILFRQHAGQISLVLTDVVMPGMNGFDLVRRMREEDGDIPILYMSGYLSAQSVVQHGVLDPNLNFVKKPFTMDALMHKVHRLLHGVNGNGAGP